MRAPFYRACRKHKEELEERTVGTGPEVLWCVIGKHRCRSWLVLDGDGETLAVAHMNEAPHIVSAELAKIDFPIPSLPEKFCRKGHFEWFLGADGRYRCRICKRDTMLKRYHNRPRITPEPPPKPAKKARKVRVKRVFKIVAPFRPDVSRSMPYKRKEAR